MGKRLNHVYTEVGLLQSPSGEVPPLPVIIRVYTEKCRMHSHGSHQTLGPELTHLANTYFWSAYSSVNFHYIALVTVCLVVLLSYMLPNISYKIHRTTELKAMKKMLDVMTKEVSRAEVACITVADQLGHLAHLPGSMHDGTTETFTEQHDLAVCTSNSIVATQSAPVQVEKKMGFFRRIFFPYKNASNKEIAIMSYLYTDSFDENKNETETNPAEPRYK